MVTEVVYWDSSKQALVAPLLDENTQANTVSWRSSKIPSMDINNDGIIEIPAHVSMSNEESVPSISNQKAPQYLTRWIQMNSDGTLFEVMRSVVNQQDHYMLKLPEDASFELTAESIANERRMDYYALEESIKRRFAVQYTCRTGVRLG
jgi:DNA-directed RNA polymerase specialized sigma54-like protein